MLNKASKCCIRPEAATPTLSSSPNVIKQEPHFEKPPRTSTPTLMMDAM